MARMVSRAKKYGKISAMSGKTNPMSYFGRQLKKERLARSWGLVELAQRTGMDAGHLSRIENGKRPPTEKLAKACDRVFADRRGWFLEYYEESKAWVPAYFKDWQELEDGAAVVHAWMPSIPHGLLQTEAYARALLSTSPGVSEETVSGRLKSRIERQRRLFSRDVLAFFVVDEFALYREVGSAEIMADQLRRLLEVSAMPNVTMQVLPAIAHPATASGFVIADDSGYAEHVVSGGVYAADAVSTLARMFDSLRAESYRATESAALIERTAEAWTGGSPLTALRTAGTA